MVLSETVVYMAMFALTIIFTAFAIVIKEEVWNILLKFIAGFFWIVLAVSNFYFMGSNGFFIVMSLPFAIFGLIFWALIYYEILENKKNKMWTFEA